MDSISSYFSTTSTQPLFIQGDAYSVLKKFPDRCINMAITSPPYWGKREYDNGGIGLEKEHDEFIERLLEIIYEIRRVLTEDGSFWLDIGDTYRKKSLIGIPWRLAIRMMDEQKWILRNEIIWNKVKGGLDNTKDKLGNVHEPIFHFVKNQKYYYDADAIRNNPQKAKVKNGKVISATGVSGVRYRRQIELSTALSNMEKQEAYSALDDILKQVSENRISDFRMIIRGQQRTTHSNSEKVSGRAKELRDKGYYFLKYHPKGSKPRDVWDIIPEDTQNRKSHFAPFPEDICKIPILATCPQSGIVLDPFMGTGTSMIVANALNRKSIGIDISEDYIELAKERIPKQLSLEENYV
ncbi:site-specific DNA-methyltransferase [Marispirochaeta sp.]|uniref:DNA-methyltransferase n=1 Tax=Marispirochaeta sp. TaxID=2038653 RepID=UPI0029C97979|nr:site-specific DNA-methyltransferase [Marispirochaeta sp.]